MASETPLQVPSPWHVAAIPNLYRKLFQAQPWQTADHLKESNF